MIYVGFSMYICSNAWTVTMDFYMVWPAISNREGRIRTALHCLQIEDSAHTLNIKLQYSSIEIQQYQEKRACRPLWLLSSAFFGLAWVVVFVICGSTATCPIVHGPGCWASYWPIWAFRIIFSTRHSTPSVHE